MVKTWLLLNPASDATTLVNAILLLIHFLWMSRTRSYRKDMRGSLMALVRVITDDTKHRSLHGQAWPPTSRLELDVGFAREVDSGDILKPITSKGGKLKDKPPQTLLSPTYQ